jgi:methylated-DNA-[protein]-cysteine S-methyltransferase
MSRPTDPRPAAPSGLHHTTLATPIGELLLLGDRHGLHGLYMQDGPRPIGVAREWEPDVAPFADAISQLDEYFAAKRVSFELPLVMHGTPFERRVWGALQGIPYGTTVSYGEIARAIGHPSASRAVGLANGRNPISVIVPCHRVIGADGGLTGYGGGLSRKRILLELESGAITLGLAVQG